MPTLSHPEPFPSQPLPDRVSPWRLKLDDCSIRPECRTPEMTAVIELTLSPVDLHLALLWLQKLEMYLITEAFCNTLLPATLSQVIIQVYGGHLIATAEANYTVDLVKHWAGGFHQVWRTVMNEPYSATRLIEQLQRRHLAPAGLGQLLLRGVEQEAAGWSAVDQQALPQHRRTWEAYFTQHGDTLESWIHFFHHQATALELGQQQA